MFVILFLWILWLFLNPLQVRGEEKAAATTAPVSKCTLAMVKWRDATVRNRSGDDFIAAIKEEKPLTSGATSIGCVFSRETQKGKELIVIQSLSEGHPDDFITIPGGWAVEIIPLKPSQDKEEEINGWLKTVKILPPAPVRK